MTTPDPDRLPDAAARVIERVRSAADPRAVVEAFGSSIYAPAHAEDVDVLVSQDDPGRLAVALGLVLLPTLPPRLHGMLDGVRVDVTVVSGDDEVARRVRSGPRDATTAPRAASCASWRRSGRFAPGAGSMLRPMVGGGIASRCPCIARGRRARSSPAGSRSTASTRHSSGGQP